MFRSLASVFCVVVMAAFVFGCGGGGGTAQMPDPDPDPGPTQPTDAERIAEAQQMIVTILSNARTRASAASAAASALGTNADATADQITSAVNHSTAAQAALSLIESADSAAQAATTPAAAQAALENAKAAQNTLNTAADAIVSIRSAVQTVTNARMQREMDERALTNNSSLIQHLRDNKLLSDAVLGTAGGNLISGDSPTTDSIRVGQTGQTTIETAAANYTPETCNEPCAIYPRDTGTGITRLTGQRMVEVVTNLRSDSTTPALRGTSTLPHGFDQSMTTGTAPGTTTTFVNAYTDIDKTKEVRRQTVLDDLSTNAVNEADYENQNVADTDYLLAGIWMTVANQPLTNSRIVAFAYGSQPIQDSTSFCAAIEVSTSGNTTATCSATNNTISGFVDDGKDLTAIYTGDANGAYIAGSDSSYFTGDVTLTAEFKNPTGGTDNGEGTIQGAVTNIVAGGQLMVGSIELQKQDLVNSISAAFEAGVAVGVVDDKSFSGNWKGQFFGRRFTRSQETNLTRDENTRVITAAAIETTYKAQAPGSVAGTFYATQRSNPAGEAAFIGSFGAER